MDIINVKKNSAVLLYIFFTLSIVSCNKNDINMSSENDAAYKGSVFYFKVQDSIGNDLLLSEAKNSYGYENIHKVYYEDGEEKIYQGSASMTTRRGYEIGLEAGGNNEYCITLYANPPKDQGSSLTFMRFGEHLVTFKSEFYVFDEYRESYRLDKVWVDDELFWWSNDCIEMRKDLEGKTGEALMQGVPILRLLPAK